MRRSGRLCRRLAVLRAGLYRATQAVLWTVMLGSAFVLLAPVTGIDIRRYLSGSAWTVNRPDPAGPFRPTDADVEKAVAVLPGPTTGRPG